MPKKRDLEGSGIVLEYLRVYCLGNNLPPSIREITRDCSISSTSVTNYYLHRLLEDGKVKAVGDKYCSRRYIPSNIDYTEVA